MWSIDAYRRMSRVPPVAVVRALSDIASKHAVVLRTPLERLVDHIRLRGEAAGLATPGDPEALAQLSELHRSVERVAGSGSEGADPDATLDVAGQWQGRS
jgi:hypothetical protein